MVFPLVIFIISLLSSIYGQKLHEYMTNDELQYIFNTHRGGVHNLDYEVIPIFHARPQHLDRNNPQIHFKAYNKNYTLYLEKNDHVLLGNNTPIFLAERSPSNSSIIYSQIKYPYPGNIQLYHDTINRAAITFHTDEDNQVHIHGIVGDNLIIRPLTQRIHQEVLRKYPEKFPWPNWDPHFSFNSNNGLGFRMPYELTTHHVVMRPTRSYFPFDNPINPPSNPFQTTNQQVNNFNQYHANWDGKFNEPNRFPFDWSSNIGPFNYNPNQEFNLNMYNRQPFPWPPTPILPPMFTPPPFTWNFPLQHQFPWNPIKPFNWPPATGTRFPSYTPRPPYVWSPTVLSPPNDWQITTTSRPNDLDPTTSAPDIHQEPTVTTTEAPAKQTEETFYPEILVAVDYDTYKFHGGDINQIATYMAAFWNAVDLRFRELHNPKIRLNIAGLIISKEVGATPYMEEHFNKNNKLSVQKSLFAIGEYFYKDTFFQKDKYDIVAAISHGTIAIGDSNSTLGMAFVGGACGHDKAKAAALITDEGGFGGIIIAVHEIGHTLGAPHDDGNLSSPERPCDGDDGYLMSYILNINKDSDNGMHWSPCSKATIHKFLNSEEAQCLKNKPNVGIPYPKELPGRLLSRDEQCRRTMNLPAHKEEEHNCGVLYCIDQMIKVTAFKPPAEGTYCGEGKICLDAVCVDDPELKDNNQGITRMSSSTVY